MSDLRKCALDVLAMLHNDDYARTCHENDKIEALRAALAETPKAVAWQYRAKFKVADDAEWSYGRWHECFDKEDADYFAELPYCYEVREIYTTPPSVDALIAEIESMITPELHNKNIYAILDKYRARGGA